MNLNYIADKIVFNFLKYIKHGKLKITNFDGKTYHFGSENDKLFVELKIKKPGLTYMVIKNGSVGLAESYMRNEFETNNLSDLIELTARNVKLIYKFTGLLDFAFFNNIKSIFLKNTIKRSKENISKHYDLGNDFFSIWLDKTLTYSSAIFEDGLHDLEKAQLNKYNKLINLINPKPGDKILEIGCGWGGFAEFVGKNYDVKLDCITISKKQYEFTKKRIQENGLNEKINIKLQDYRNIKDKCR